MYCLCSKGTVHQTSLTVPPGPDLIPGRPQAGVDLHPAGTQAAGDAPSAASPLSAVILPGYTLSSWALAHSACCLQKRTPQHSDLQELRGAGFLASFNIYMHLLTHPINEGHCCAAF